MHRQPQQGRGWDPILYVLLFLYGTDRFHLDISRTARQSVTAMEYCCCWRLMQRNGQA